MVAATGFLNQCFDPKIVEGVTFHWSIQLAHYLLFQRIVFESD